jgi:hypothetical protein
VQKKKRTLSSWRMRAAYDAASSSVSAGIWMMVPKRLGIAKVRDPSLTQRIARARSRFVARSCAKNPGIRKLQFGPN